MGHYKANLRDIEFNLFEVLGIDELLDNGVYGDLDTETVKAVLDEVVRLAEGPVAESWAEADRHPTEFDVANASVKLPDALKRSIKALMEADFVRLGLDEGMGGEPAPAPLFWSIQELLVSANPAANFNNLGPVMANVLYKEGNEQQKKWASFAYENKWAATMVLTEPDAGSDVGAGRTKAIEQPDGTWHIEGVKRFITGGDVDDVSPNLFHLVLARPEGAGPGTKGLSLFYVPKFHHDPETMEIGERNGAYVTGVEHKMGIKSSATCEVTFGATDNPAVGWLVGDKHDGIAQMFKVIENARMMVGTKAAGTLSTGYLNALAYAKERVQGADLTHSMDKAAPRVTIMHHPDVRRSLAMQKAYAEGLRAVWMYCAAHQDPVVAEKVSGADAAMAHRVDDFLLPIVKGVGSERAYEMLTESLQTLGGSGFLQDYPIEQYIRDAKIDSLYEGTTAIQAQDFFFRKIARDKGGAYGHVTGEIKKFIDAEGPESLKDERELLQTALDDIHAINGQLFGHLMGAQRTPSELYKVGLASVRFLLAVGDLMIGWRLLLQAQIALEKLDDEDTSDKDRRFYEGKVAVASFFCYNVLPRISATRQIISTVCNDIMELDEAAF
ncbi:MAG: acyl-CoA dehydrogenase [Nocardiaceae bacterium]|nr:acyl-CoA dehydrogenase [Nocardiaceae bacterium]